MSDLYLVYLSFAVGILAFCLYQLVSIKLIERKLMREIAELEKELAAVESEAKTSRTETT